MKSWTITIRDDGRHFAATITNDQTGATLSVPEQEYDAESDGDWERDDAIADLFNGRKPNIRDSFDTV